MSIQAPSVCLTAFAATIAMLAVSADAVAQGVLPIPQGRAIAQVRHSTYDYTEEGVAVPNAGLRETWVDVKTPGNGWTYSVGSVDVQRTRLPSGAPAQFSERDALVATGLTGFASLAVGLPSKQVVMLQAVGPDATTGVNQTIRWQRFYYGLDEDGDDYANARAISVWADADPQNTRIAICGESTHDRLPLDQFASGALTGTATTKGFIAIFDGDGQHLWTHSIFLRDANSNWRDNMAVTDVSIRVEGERDVITYCGITRAGAFGLATDPGQAVLPFLPPANCASAAGGNVQIPNQSWDGFVGRISRDRALTQATRIDFHSTVGGQDDDGLFGIEEVDANRFVVVGSSRRSAVVSGITFPFTSACLPNASATNYGLGVAMVFDATPTSNNGLLLLEWSHPLGSQQQHNCSSAGPADSITMSRDVCVKRNYFAVGDHLVLVAGSSTDCSLFQAWNIGAPTVPHQGALDGFVLGLHDRVVTTAPAQASVGTFRGSAGNEEIRGIQTWSEHRDHFSVVSSIGTAPATDMEIASYWLLGGVVALEKTSVRLDRNDLTGVTTPTLGFLAARTGTQNAGLADAQGGGITIDESGRVTVVGGMTDPTPTSAYAVSTTLHSTILAQGRGNNFALEAYRAVLDMLPDQVGRTDGTGVPVPSPGTQFPVAGYFGGTTPECALTPYGLRIGVAPVSILSRMLINTTFLSQGVLSPPVPGATMQVFVDAPPGGAIAISAWQLGFPGASASSPVPAILDGVLLWTPNVGATYVLGTGGNSVYQEWYLPNTTSTAQVTVQLVCALATSIPGDVVGATCSGTTTWAASPALWVQF